LNRWAIITMALILFTSCESDYSVTASLTTEQMSKMLKTDRSFENTIEFVQQKNISHSEEQVFHALFSDLGYHEFHRFYVIIDDHKQKEEFIKSRGRMYDQMIDTALIDYKSSIDEHFSHYVELLPSSDVSRIVDVTFQEYKHIQHEGVSNPYFTFEIVPLSGSISEVVFDIAIATGVFGDQEPLKAALRMSESINSRTVRMWGTPYEFEKEINSRGPLYRPKISISIRYVTANSKTYSRENILKNFPVFCEVLGDTPKPLSTDIYREILNKKYGKELQDRDSYLQNQYNNYLKSISETAFDYYSYGSMPYSGRIITKTKTKSDLSLDDFR